MSITIKEVETSRDPKILVIGAGGGGNNAVNRMVASGVKGVDFAVVNTDKLVLDRSLTQKKLQIGEKLLKGFGAGADPEIGESAAMESEEEIRSLVDGCNMVIITCGMGGGTGTGAAPVIAKICKEISILTLGVVTLPFTFEGNQRMAVALQGVDRLKEWVDTLFIIPNDKLLSLSDKPLLVDTAFEMADSVLKNSIETIANIVYNGGTINIDYNDLNTTFSGKGKGHIGVGIVGADKAPLDAVKMAVNSPLLDSTIEGAEVLLVNTCGRVDINSLNEAISYLTEITGKNTKVIWGTVHPDEIDEDKIMVTLIATGMKTKSVPIPAQPSKQGTVKTFERREFPTVTIKRSVPVEELKIPEFLKAYSERNVLK